MKIVVCSLLLSWATLTLAVPSSNSATSSADTRPVDTSKILQKRDYKAPDAPPASPPATADNGYYYYYYPVEEDKKAGLTKDKDPVDKLLAVAIVIAVLLGLIFLNMVGVIPTITKPDPLALLSLSGRSLMETASSMSDYVPWGTMEKMTEIVTTAVESEDCLLRLICASGKYADGYNTTVSLLGYFSPPRYQAHMKVFKDSALKDTDCTIYRCSYLDHKKKI